MSLTINPVPYGVDLQNALSVLNEAYPDGKVFLITLKSTGKETPNEYDIQVDDQNSTKRVSLSGNAVHEDSESSELSTETFETGTPSSSKPTSPSTVSPNPFRGLEWVDEVFGPEPRWTYEPESEAIFRTAMPAISKSLQSPKSDPIKSFGCKFLTEGTFNKIYDVEVDGQNFIMRVSLPVDPVFKTRSEVATVDWIRLVTDIPIPKILAYDATRETEVGFEWILMSKMPGQPLDDYWPTMPMATKMNLVKRFAAFSASLWRNQLKGIGNIYPASVTTEDTRSNQDPSATDIPVPMVKHITPNTSRIVSLEFVTKSHTYQDVVRGPFASSHQWMVSRLCLAKNDCYEQLLKYSVDDDDAEGEMERAKKTLRRVENLELILPRIFPLLSKTPEPTMIFHDDLNSSNILVSDKGELTAVLDWELVSALPLWKACYFPSFLDGMPRDDKPDIEWYDDGNPQPGTAYWEHLNDYETTVLRKFFLEEMKKSEPGWVDIFNASQLQRDFDTALQHFKDAFGGMQIDSWISDVIIGKEPKSLREAVGL
ncbi:Aminoglycoside phosphotransferase [Penicillium verhagenii]|uniref:Aminoglycoside phosphotransferase n=1 Tax=Penicillium verhagenii TaxID=1562060 RepID=UPI002545AF0B|nr:Aminoglycoside phosphotransferase [Penicillium verhagenii]KAJ5930484.1 Aminoglycoside phosphotransferase [Penicillium verhagenii]